MPEQLETILVAPPGRHDATVIWMHGLGADGSDFLPIVTQLGLPSNHGIRFIFPHAPVRTITLNQGMSMRGWYDVKALNTGTEPDVDGIVSSSSSIAELVQNERSSGIPANRIMLAGFSQGGAIALYCGLRYSVPLAGICALSCYLVLAERLATEAHLSNLDTPIFMAHGIDDPLIVASVGERSRDQLQERGYQVDWHDYPMAHAVCAEEISDIGGFIRTRLISS